MTLSIPRALIYRRQRFDAATIQLCVRWYITYRLSYRDLSAILAEQGIRLSHTTILRWVIRMNPSVYLSPNGPPDLEEAGRNEHQASHRILAG